LAQVYIRDCSPVPPLAILLFGGGEVVQVPFFFFFIALESRVE